MKRNEPDYDQLKPNQVRGFYGDFNKINERYGKRVREGLNDASEALPELKALFDVYGINYDGLTPDQCISLALGTYNRAEESVRRFNEGEKMTPKDLAKIIQPELFGDIPEQKRNRSAALEDPVDESRRKHKR